MTTIQTPKTVRQPSAEATNKLLTGLSAKTSEYSRERLPQDFRQLTGEEELFLTAGLRWAALKLESIVEKDTSAKQRRVVEPLIKVYEEIFAASKSDLPDPTLTTDQLTAAAADFSKFRQQLISQAAPHSATFDRLKNGKTTYFDLVGELKKNEGATSPILQPEVTQLKKYISLMLTRISGHYRDFVVKVLCKGPNKLREEQFSAAFPGLIDGLARFQPERGYRLGSFVSPWVTQERAKTMHYENHSIYHPRRVALDLRALKRSANELGIPVFDLTDSGVVEALAGNSKLSPRKFAAQLKLVRAACSANVSKNGQRLGENGEEYVADAKVVPAWEQAAAAELKDLTQKALDELPERLATVIDLRFGLSGKAPQTLQEVATTLGVSDERVRQLQGKALTLLRHRIDPLVID